MAGAVEARAKVADFAARGGGGGPPLSPCEEDGTPIGQVGRAEVMAVLLEHAAGPQAAKPGFPS